MIAEPLLGIEPRFHPYQGCALPLSYKGKAVLSEQTSPYRHKTGRNASICVANNSLPDHSSVPDLGVMEPPRCNGVSKGIRTLDILLGKQVF